MLSHAGAKAQLRAFAIGASLLLCITVYSYVFFSSFNIPYLELSAIYASSFLFFLINGAGTFSLDNLIAKWINKKVASQRYKLV